MTQKVLLTVFFFFLINNAFFAQDTLISKNGEKIIASSFEKNIVAGTIYYKQTGMNKNTMLFILMSDLTAIHYADGTTEEIPEGAYPVHGRDRIYSHFVLISDGRHFISNGKQVDLNWIADQQPDNTALRIETEELIKSKHRSILASVTGGVFLFGGLLSGFANYSLNGSEVPAVVMGVAGFISIGIAVKHQNQRDKHIKRILALYNRH
jgi:hypothetical protein